MIAEISSPGSIFADAIAAAMKSHQAAAVALDSHAGAPSEGRRRTAASVDAEVCRRLRGSTTRAISRFADYHCSPLRYNDAGAAGMILRLKSD